MNLHRYFTESDPNTIIEHYPEVENWLGQVKSYAIDQIPNSIPEKFYLLLKTIHAQFNKAARSLEARKSVNDRNLNTYDLLTPRYAIELEEVNGYSGILYLWDIGYGQKR
jgi:hypothetical protein